MQNKAILITMKKCDCKKWKENSHKLNDMQLFSLNQTAAPKRYVDVFRFCPWCGHLLTGESEYMKRRGQVILGNHEP